MSLRTPLSKTAKIAAAFGAIIVCAALMGQLYLSISNREVPLAETIVRYFSYFTILSNLLVALCFTLLWLWPQTKGGQFFSRAAVQGGLTVYIFIVCLVYNLVLRQIWEPEGLQRVVDELLHVVVPLYFVAWFLIFADKKPLKWPDLPKWLLFPLVYLVFVLVRGAFSGFYPYPFLDVSALGYPKVLINCLGIGLAIFVVSILLLLICKWMVKKSG